MYKCLRLDLFNLYLGVDLNACYNVAILGD